MSCIHTPTGTNFTLMVRHRNRLVESIGTETTLRIIGLILEMSLR